MTIDLTALLRGEVKTVDISCTITPDSAPEGIKLLPGAMLKGKIEDSGGYIRLTSTAFIPYSGECARCLNPVNGTLEFDFNRTLVTEGTLSEERLIEDADEYLQIKHGILEPDEALSESVFLEFPMLLLCSEDCQGLCPKCGRRMDSSEKCNCSTKEIDPRWAKLKELFPDD